MTVLRDATDPVVTITGGGTYTVADSITVSCSASDATSGIASSTCAPTSTRPATDYPVGTTLLSASAVDRAGNTGGATAPVTVTVDTTSLCTLTRRLVSKPGVASSMCAKLSAAEDKNDRDGRQAALDNYRHEVSSQSGKSLTAESASLLTNLSLHL